MAQAVQFYGIEPVLKAYENRGCPAWAIYCGKQFLFKYEGDDVTEGANMLEELLKTITAGTGLYTLKVYENEGNKPVKIKENMPCDGSFNFRLIAEEERMNRMQVYSNTRNEVIEKLNGIERRLQEIEEGTDEEEESQLDQIAGFIERNPTMINLIAGIFGIGNKTNSQPATLAGVPDDQVLSNAIAILKKNDPKLPEHLHKLAAISEHDKGTWNYLTGMLDKM